MSKEFWCETWELLEEEAAEKFRNYYGREANEQQIKEYCEAHIEERNKERMGDMIDHVHDRMKYGDH